mmetsp:Transcript_5247/g.16447  ORF Transcript_5247/g.16447 Transcript_5247/m.16447 type:complete len:216 (+) Transcript_5247:712-1359(+)
MEYSCDELSALRPAVQRLRARGRARHNRRSADRARFVKPKLLGALLELGLHLGGHFGGRGRRLGCGSRLRGRRSRAICAHALAGARGLGLHVAKSLLPLVQLRLLLGRERGPRSCAVLFAIGRNLAKALLSLVQLLGERGVGDRRRDERHAKATCPHLPLLLLCARLGRLGRIGIGRVRPRLCCSCSRRRRGGGRSRTTCTRSGRGRARLRNGGL